MYQVQKSKSLPLSNSLENLLFPSGKYTAAQLLTLTPYFNTGLKLTYEKHCSLMKQIFDNQDEKMWWLIKAQYGEVDAKALILILMLRLIGRQKSGYNQGVKNQAIAKNENNNMTSPRSKTTRALYISNEQTIIMHYIKDNLTTFLKLLTNQPNVEDPFVDASELQPLSILFKVDRSKKFSSFLPIFNKSQKLKASTISDHLMPRITISQQQLVSLEGLSYSVPIKQEIHCRDKDLRIIGCEYSEIFIDSSVRSLYIVNCVNCTIYVAACERIAFIDKCQRVFFTVASRLLRICNTMDSSVYYYGQSPIIMTGENRSVSIGPNNCTLVDIANHLKAVRIQVNPKYMTNFQQVIYKSLSSSQVQNSGYCKMEPSEFDLLVLPIKNEDDKLKTKDYNSPKGKFLAPKEYLDDLEERNKYFSLLKSKLCSSQISSQMVKNLHCSIQGNFKQWLNVKGYTKNLEDLVKTLDKNGR